MDFFLAKNRDKRADEHSQYPVKNYLGKLNGKKVPEINKFPC
jgi:hypothetical protein